MGTARIFRGLLSIFLTGALVFPSLAAPAAAETPEGSTLPAQIPEAEPQAAEETVPAPETVPQTEAGEAFLLPGQSAPAQTLPQETIPVETVPDGTLSQAAPSQKTPEAVDIAAANAMAEGTAGITLRGTVVYSGNGITVLQDQTGGIRLTFSDGISTTAGTVLRVTGSRTADGLAVTDLAAEGSAALPEEEAVIGSLPECRRVVIKKAAFHSGSLIQGSHSISMSPLKPEGISDGDMVNAWGVLVGNWFYADTVTLVQSGTALSPVVTATPLNGLLLPGENVGLHCSMEGASIYYSYSCDGVNYSAFSLYSCGIPVDSSAEGIYVRAYGVSPGGTAGAQTEFYFEWESQETPESTTGESGGWNLYFGLLHAHTGLSDGMGTVEEAFTHAANVDGLDFFAVTDHSDSFDSAGAGSLLSDGKTISREWAEGKAAAAAVTGSSFVGIFGYEMTWPDGVGLGHINTFNTPGWQSSTQAGFSTLESYYQALTTVPGSVSQFNHPGVSYGYFDNFGHYDAAYDAVIQLLEVGSGDGYTAYDYYDLALDKGWHVAPANNQANHRGNWGDESSVRTVVLAKTLSEESLYDAIRDYRVYATEDSDLEILYSLNGSIMGSTLRAAAQTASVTLRDPTDAVIGRVEVIADGGLSVAGVENVSANGTLSIQVPGGYRYYYLRITQPDGDIAVTAPVWVDQTVDTEIQSFTADPAQPVQGQEVQLTLSLHNSETSPFVVEKLEFTADGTTVYSVQNPGTAAALGSFSYSFPFLHNGLGRVELQAVATGTLEGTTKTCEAALSLYYQPAQSEVSRSTIAYVRKGTEGQVYRVKGYVTAGTSNPYTTFPGTIYLQDGTGGIAVTSFTGSSVQLGAPMELTGYLAQQDGNPVLELLDYELLSEDYHSYTPAALSNRAAMDPDTYGGQLLQLEGQVVSLTRTADGKGVSRFTMKDTAGDLAAVRIDDAILSASTGTNQLTAQVITGCWVRAIGILHREADGTPVLRVRNCDEVTYVSASSVTGGIADPSNPKTGIEEFTAPFGAGIPTPLLLTVLGITAAGLGALYQLKKQRRH